MKPLNRMLRKFVPRSLLGRSLLIILVPLIVVQAVALQVFYGNHLDVFSRRLAAGVAGDIGFALDMMRRFPERAEAMIAAELSEPGSPLHRI